MVGQSTRPLYRGAASPCLAKDGNRGLWFDKFCDKWRRTGRSWTMKADKADRADKGGKLRWLESVAGKNGESERLIETRERILRLVERRGGRVAVYKSESRFVTGLGLSHPVENGFAWHPTLGTPYLPGSSIKGMIRAWAREEGVPVGDLCRLLGAAGERDEGRASAGALSFLDALPIDAITLEVDVLTPHYAGWDEDDPPGDWRSPVPVPFLVVAEGMQLLFGVIPRRAVSETELDAVFGWLDEALSWAGAGAKVAVGYGRFVVDRPKISKYEEFFKKERSDRRKAELKKTPHGKWQVKVEECVDEGAVLELVRVHLEKEPLEDPVERAALIAAIESTGYVDSWKKGKAKAGAGLGKKKLKKYYQLVREAGSEAS